MANIVQQGGGEQVGGLLGRERLAEHARTGAGTAARVCSTPSEWAKRLWL
ncbi:MAG: hypothetical protein U0736_18170 [Gemmataceae bacterium]